jgi:hypothetical protein
MYKSSSAQPGTQAPPSDAGDRGKDIVVAAEFLDAGP